MGQHWAQWGLYSVSRTICGRLKISTLVVIPPTKRQNWFPLFLSHGANPVAGFNQYHMAEVVPGKAQGQALRDTCVNCAQATILCRSPYTQHGGWGYVQELQVTKPIMTLPWTSQSRIQPNGWHHLTQKVFNLPKFLTHCCVKTQHWLLIHRARWQEDTSLCLPTDTELIISVPFYTVDCRWLNWNSLQNSLQNYFCLLFETNRTFKYINLFKSHGKAGV